MTTFEALGEQFGLKGRTLYNSLIAVLAVSLIFAIAVIITVKVFNTPITISNSDSTGKTSQPIVFPPGSQGCLQNCQSLNYQAQGPNLQAKPITIQRAANVMNY